jgi:hypothetical protein
VLRNNEFVTENAGGLKATGFEVETILRVNSSLKVNASTTYSDAQYTDYLTSCPNSVVAAGPPPSPLSATPRVRPRPTRFTRPRASP